MIGKLREIERQLEARSSGQLGFVGTVVQRTWLNAKQLAQKMKYNDFPESPSLFFLKKKIEFLETKHTSLMKKRQRERVAAWKEKMRHDWFQSRRQVFQWLRNEPFSSVSLIRRPDGTLTGNLQEIDQLVQDAWKPIFSKYANTPEPSWEAFRARFGTYIRTARQELTPITGEQLAAAIKKQSNYTAIGFDGWRSIELKRLPVFLWDYFAQVLNAVETSGKWPGALLQALCALIPKDPEKIPH